MSVRASERQSVERKRLIAEAKRQRREIQQYFTDVASWNDNRGKVEGAIDPDPDGSMGEMADKLDQLLERETLRASLVRKLLRKEPTV